MPVRPYRGGAVGLARERRRQRDGPRKEGVVDGRGVSTLQGGGSGGGGGYTKL